MRLVSIPVTKVVVTPTTPRRRAAAVCIPMAPAESAIQDIEGDRPGPTPVISHPASKPAAGRVRPAEPRSRTAARLPSVQSRLHSHTNEDAQHESRKGNHRSDGTPLAGPDRSRCEEHQVSGHVGRKHAPESKKTDPRRTPGGSGERQEE